MTFPLTWYLKQKLTQMEKNIIIIMVTGFALILAVFASYVTASYVFTDFSLGSDAGKQKASEDK